MFLNGHFLLWMARPIVLESGMTLRVTVIHISLLQRRRTQ